MKKYIFLIFILLIGCSSSNELSVEEAVNATIEAKNSIELTVAAKLPTSTPFSKNPVEILAEKANKSIVYIQSDYDVGTGFVINNDGLILTAQHVVDGAKEIFVSPFQSSYTGKAEVIYSNFESDLAILKTDINFDNYLSIETSDQINFGHDVVSIGYPVTNDFSSEDIPSISKGIVSKKFESSDVNIIEHDAQISPGFSGGPLISVTTGNVVGVNSVVFENVGGDNYLASSYIEINKALRQKNIIQSIDGSLVYTPPPTSTPIPTAKPIPTRAPSPTSTPRPYVQATPTRGPSPTSTPRPWPTSTPIPPTPTSKYTDLACEFSVYEPSYYEIEQRDDGLLYVGKTFKRSELSDLEILRTKPEGQVGTFDINHKLTSFTMSAEFLLLDKDKSSSFGFLIRKHNSNHQSYSDFHDAILISYKPEQTYNKYSLRHHIRNEVTLRDFEETGEYGYDISINASQNLSSNQFNTGPRGWNKLYIEANEGKGKLFLNDQLIYSFDLDKVKSSTEYTNRPIHSYYSGDEGQVLLRSPDVGCID